MQRLTTIVQTYYMKHKVLATVTTGVICSIFLANLVSQKFLNNPLPLPFAVLYTDKTSVSTAVTYLTAAPIATCVSFSRGGLFGAKRACDTTPSRVHRLEVTGLSTGAVYSITITNGWVHWNYYVADIRPKASEFYSTTLAAGLLPLVPPSNTAKSDPNTSLTFKGVVVNEKDKPQPGAVVVFAKSGGITFWSTKTDSDGKFSIAVPQLIPSDHVFITVWSNTGMTSLQKSAEALLSEENKIAIDLYE